MAFIDGTDAPETITGTEEPDILSGRGGDDHLIGLGGQDFLFGGAGADILEGGESNDSYMLLDDDSDTVIDSGGIDGISTYISLNLERYPEIENVRQVKPYDGRELRGNDLDNEIEDSGGNNKLFGGAGWDHLDGGRGNDFLNGGTGQDYLKGGLGSDRFDFVSPEDSPLGEANRDYIQDFTQGEDTLNFGYMDANAKHASNQAFSFVGDAEFSGTAGELRYEFGLFSDRVNKITLISGDTDGDGIADFEVQLWGNIALTASDFIL